MWGLIHLWGWKERPEIAFSVVQVGDGQGQAQTLSWDYRGGKEEFTKQK